MRSPSFTRHLKPSETEYARKVFRNVLPWPEIGVTDGLGAGGTVWTHTRSMIPFAGAVSSPFQYYVNFGDAANADLSTEGVSLSTYVPGYPYFMCDVFIHELTHVWQYSRPYAKAGEIAARCIYAQKFGAGYAFTAGNTWASYNLEQQASIVEEWNKRKRKEDDELFPYIHYVIRKEGLYRPDPRPGADRTVSGIVYTDFWFANEADLAQLQVLLDMERMPVPLDEPVRVTVKDDSFIVVLSGDVLFDFGKFDLKPAADLPLEQAWAKIKSNPRRRKVFVNGHTDSIGQDRYNLRLSEQRAKAVAEWFFRRSYLAPSMVSIQGFGKTQPLAPNTTAQGRARNRRVEIYLSNN